MAELRYVGIKLEVQDQNGITKMRQFKTAVKDVDGVVDELTQSLGENVKVSTESIKTDQEVIKQARAKARSFQQAEKRTEALTQEYTHMISRLGKTADEQERLNAIHRLGANATKEQIQQVDQMVAKYQQLRSQTTKTGTSFRNLRGISQNLSWQLADVAVQAEMGVDPVRILTQQGSQAAAAFGALGAAVGAALAILGSTLGPVISKMLDTKSATQALKEAQENLSDIFDRSKYSIKGFSSELQELYELDKELAELEMTRAMLELDKTVNQGQKSILKTLGDIRRLGSEMESTGHKGRLAREVFFSKMAKDFKISEADLQKLITATREFSKATDGEVAPAAEKLGNIVKSIAADGKVSEEFRDSAIDVAKWAAEIGLSAKQVEKLKGALSGGEGLGTDDKAADGIQKVIDRYAVLTLKLKDQDAAAALLSETQKLKLDQDSEEAKKLKAVIDRYHELKAAKEADDQATKAAKAARDQLISDLDKIEKKLLKATVPEETSAALQYVETQNKIAEAVKSGITTEEQARQMNLMNYQAYVQQVTEIDRKRTEVEQKEADKRHQIQVAEMQNYVTMIGALGNVFGRLSSIAEEGSKEAETLFYINQAIALAETIVNTELAATKAMGQAGLFGISASTAIRAMGYASAGIIAGTTISGAYDEGGQIPNGKVGIVSEYGDELVNGVLVKGPANVTGRKDTERIMSGEGATAGSPVINVYPIAGTTAEISTRSDGQVDVRMREIADKVFAERIDSGVAGVVGNPNSKTSKQFNRSYNARRQL